MSRHEDLPLEQEKRRIDWIDTAKGIGIILVVMQHTALDYAWIGKWINTFHMPLFFFLSGFFFRPGKVGGFGAFAAKKSRSLLLPYFAFAALSYLYFILRYSFGDSDYYRDLNVLQVLAGIAYSAGIREWMDFNLPLWFLTCLFVTEMMYYGIKRWVPRKTGTVLVLAVCSLIGYADGLWNPYKLPWGIDVAFTAVVFFGGGQLLREAVGYMAGRAVWLRLAAACLLLAVNLVFTLDRVNVNMKLHGSYYDFYLAAFAGVGACLLLAGLIRVQALDFLGRNALVIMACHSPMLNLASKVTGRLGWESGAYGTECLRVAVTMAALVPVVYAVNRFAPFLLGKRAAYATGYKRSFPKEA